MLACSQTHSERERLKNGWHKQNVRNDSRSEKCVARKESIIVCMLFKFNLKQYNSAVVYAQSSTSSVDHTHSMCMVSFEFWLSYSHLIDIRDKVKSCQICLTNSQLIFWNNKSDHKLQCDNNRKALRSKMRAYVFVCVFDAPKNATQRRRKKKSTQIFVD